MGDRQVREARAWPWALGVGPSLSGGVRPDFRLSQGARKNEKFINVAVKIERLMPRIALMRFKADIAGILGKQLAMSPSCAELVSVYGLPVDPDTDILLSQRIPLGPPEHPDNAVPDILVHLPVRHETVSH